MNYDIIKNNDFIPSTRIHNNFVLEKHKSLINKEKKKFRNSSDPI